MLRRETWRCAREFWLMLPRLGFAAPGFQQSAAFGLPDIQRDDSHLLPIPESAATGDKKVGFEEWTPGNRERAGWCAESDGTEDSATSSQASVAEYGATSHG